MPHKAKMIAGVTAPLLLAALLQPAGAVQIRRVVTDVGAVLRLRGEVTAKDYGRLKDLLQNSAVIGLEIRSGGGSLEAGIDIARVVRERRLAVYVSRECDSVCAFIFFAAKERFMERGSKIGVHSVSNDRGKEDSETARLTLQLSRLLARAGVPASILGKIVATPATRITFLDRRDLAGLNVHWTNPFQTIYAAARASRSQLTSAVCSSGADPNVDEAEPAGSRSCATALAPASEPP